MLICKHRCKIGEGPIWNEKERKLYYTNGLGNEIVMLDVYTGEFEVRPVDVGIAAFAFTKNNDLIVSRSDGVFILNEDNSVKELYDTQKVKISFANDMKTGPDGRLYVGTQSGKWAKTSDQLDGKLYSIDKDGNVRVLLDDMILSNGLDWSVDEKYLYHTDNITKIIKEYYFDKISGDIEYTGRQVEVIGVDGFTVDKNNNILAACWGQGHIAVIDTKSFKIQSYIEIPAKIPASCGFAGDNMELFAVVTASYHADIKKDFNAGFTFVFESDIGGRKPYLFG